MLKDLGKALKLVELDDLSPRREGWWLTDLGAGKMGSWLLHKQALRMEVRDTEPVREECFCHQEDLVACVCND